MDFTKFSSKLEPFLLMAKSAKGAAAARLIEDATAAPGVFVFGELLEVSNIQELEKSEQYAKHLALLQLFAYKTYQDYLSNKDAYPALNKAQITKLKHLSIVSLASERRILPYSSLLSALEVSSVRELEDLIIDGIYLDLLQGKLDQKEEQLEVSYTMGRDLEPGRLERVLDALKAWASTTSAILSTLDAKIASIAQENVAQKQRQVDYDRAVQATLKEVYDKQKDKSLGGLTNVSGGGGIGLSMGGGRSRATGTFPLGERGGDRGDAMDVDEPEKGKNRKTSTDSGSKPLRKRNKF